VDGSFGEGGGQILRNAMCFSMVMQVPIHVTRIRAGRRIPGLRPQHSATIKILSEVCSAQVKGAEVGSTELSFSPGPVRSTHGTFNLETAASIPLVLQAIVPAISLMASDPYEMEIVGGTDVPWSPTSDYLRIVVAAAMRAVGISFSLEITRRGYYPNGGGRVRFRIEPCGRVGALQLSSRRDVERAGGAEGTILLTSRCGRLPASVAERQARAAAAVLRALEGGEGGKGKGEGGAGAVTTTRRRTTTIEDDVRLEESISPGSSILVSYVEEGCYIGGDSIGARGKLAEVVGREAASKFLAAFNSGARIDGHLADMLAPLLCLSEAPSAVVVPFATEHLRTSLHVAAQFTAATYTLEPAGEAMLLTISPVRAQ
jgi:RNA 3'-phosphate cyclase